MSLSPATSVTPSGTPTIRRENGSEELIQTAEKNSKVEAGVHKSEDHRNATSRAPPEKSASTAATAAAAAMSANDPWNTSAHNPRNWSRGKKWGATLTSCYMSLLVSIASTGYSQGTAQIAAEFHVPDLLSVSGISFFTIAVAFFPLILAPLGEAFGRQPVYLGSYALFFLFFLPTALARNMATILVSRFINGAAGSVGATMVGGTMNDLWVKEERDLPMSFFAVTALEGIALGLVGFTWAGGPVTWRWIYWTMLMLAVPSAVLILLFFRQETLPKETRLRLKEAAANAGLDSGQTLEPEQAQQEKKGLTFKDIREALIKSAIRPLYFLCTEPIALALSLWIAFAWSTLYLFLETVPLVFEPYGFNAASYTRGATFTGIGVGTLIGLGIHCLVIRNRKPTKEPEERLGEACFGSLIFAAGFFIYAWTASPGKIPWIVPQIGTAIIMVGLYLFYICVFDYFGDCYGAYTASAIAAQSFLRNILATAFPLFATRMYQNLTYPWASSLLGFLALALSSVPFLLRWKGKELRARSPFAVSQAGVT